MDHIYSDLCIDDLAYKIVQALVQLRLIVTRDHLDMLDEVREVKADEVDPRVTVYILI